MAVFRMNGAEIMYLPGGSRVTFEDGRIEVLVGEAPQSGAKRSTPSLRSPEAEELAASEVLSARAMRNDAAAEALREVRAENTARADA